MKKQIILIVVVLMLIPFAFSQNPNFYSNSLHGYFGYSSAFYFGKDDEADIDIMLQIAKTAVTNTVKGMNYKFLSDIKKMTKEESFLLWQALREFDYEIGEYYLLAVFPKSQYSAFILVKVTSSDNIAWWDLGRYQ